MRTMYQFGWCAGLATITYGAGAPGETVAWVLAGAMAVQLGGRMGIRALNRIVMRRRVHEVIRFPDP